MDQRFLECLQADNRDVEREPKGFSLGKRAGESV